MKLILKSKKLKKIWKFRRNWKEIIPKDYETDPLKIIFKWFCIATKLELKIAFYCSQYCQMSAFVCYSIINIICLYCIIYWKILLKYRRVRNCWKQLKVSKICSLIKLYIAKYKKKKETEILCAFNFSFLSNFQSVIFVSFLYFFFSKVSCFLIFFVVIIWRDCLMCNYVTPEVWQWKEKKRNDPVLIR